LASRSCQTRTLTGENRRHLLAALAAQTAERDEIRFGQL